MRSLSALVASAGAGAFGQLEAAAAIGAGHVAGGFNIQIDARMAEGAAAAVTIDAAFLDGYGLVFI
jgi:hypothetical protein